MKKYYFLGMITALCVAVVVLLSAVEGVIYADTDFYEREYKKYHVLQTVRMDMDELLDVTEEMLDYLKGERADLTLTAVVDGAEREFFNEKEKSHMADVKELFMIGNYVRLGAAALAVLCVVVFLRKKQVLALLRMMQWGIGLVLCMTGGLVYWLSQDFTKGFEQFHHILFDNMNWYLNPETDLLINIVPEGFFRDVAAIIGILFAGVCVLFWIGAALLRIRLRKKNAGNA